VQTAFLKAYKNLDRFQVNARFSTWLIRIAMNESFMKLRKQVSKKEQSLNPQNGSRDEGNNHSQLDLTDWATNPE
jgi:RNA polymerase sigma-70 factor (ECF subfamily)